MRITPYIKPTAVYAVVYILLCFAIAILAGRFGIKHPTLRTMTLLVSAFCAVMVFIKSQGAAPKRKDSIALTLASLAVFWLVTNTLRSLASMPFVPAIFAMQTLTHVALSYLVYGYIAQKYVAPPPIDRSHQTAKERAL